MKCLIFFSSLDTSQSYTELARDSNHHKIIKNNNKNSDIFLFSRYFLGKEKTEFDWQ